MVSVTTSHRYLKQGIMNRISLSKIPSTRSDRCQGHQLLARVEIVGISDLNGLRPSANTVEKKHPIEN